MTPEKIGEFEYAGETLHVFRSAYQTNDSLAVFAYDDHGRPFVTISENHDLRLQPGHFVAQTRNMTPALLMALLACGLFEQTKRTHQFGGYDACEPIWRIVPKRESCCADPQVRGGKCENCGEWIEDRTNMPQGDNEG